MSRQISPGKGRKYESSYVINNQAQFPQVIENYKIYIQSNTSVNSSLYFEGHV